MPWALKGDCDADYPQQAVDYVLTLKANHGKLHHAVQQWFEQERTTMATARSASVRRSKLGITGLKLAVTECPHRPGCVTPVVSVARTAKFGIVVRERRLWNQITTEVHLSPVCPRCNSLPMPCVHWQIENTLHWTLDVTFREGCQSFGKGHAAENFALLRRLSVNLLKQENTFKGSLRMKRYKAGQQLFTENPGCISPSVT